MRAVADGDEWALGAVIAEMKAAGGHGQSLAGRPDVVRQIAEGLVYPDRARPLRVRDLRV